MIKKNKILITVLLASLSTIFLVGCSANDTNNKNKDGLSNSQNQQNVDGTDNKTENSNTTVLFKDNDILYKISGDNVTKLLTDMKDNFKFKAYKNKIYYINQIVDDKYELNVIDVASNKSEKISDINYDFVIDGDFIYFGQNNELYKFDINNNKVSKITSNSDKGNAENCEVISCDESLIYYSVTINDKSNLYTITKDGSKDSIYVESSQGIQMQTDNKYNYMLYIPYGGVVTEFENKTELSGNISVYERNSEQNGIVTVFKIDSAPFITKFKVYDDTVYCLDEEGNLFTVEVGEFDATAGQPIKSDVVDFSIGNGNLYTFDGSEINMTSLNGGSSKSIYTHEKQDVMDEALFEN